jgi:hypothetical protein
MADDYNVQRYRGCGCARCRMRGLMGPAILVTIGVLLLFNEFHLVRFHYTWPVILIVIGVVKVLVASASVEGHRGLVLGPQGGSGGPQAPSGPGSDPSQVKNA